MRILDEDDKEMTEEEADLTKGYFTYENIKGKHHDEVKEEPEEFHYRVATWYFENGERMEMTDENDPHIKVIDADTGKFEYVDQGEGYTYRGADIARVIDHEYVEHKDAYDEQEQIKRYHLYTEEELAAQEAANEKAAKQTKFLNEGPDQLDTNTSSIEDLTVMVSEMAGIA